MYLNKIFVLLFLSITIAGCKDYYNETIEWVDNLERGLNIETVQRRQPNYIEIDWENPQVIENQKWYLIVKIKGNSDILNMSHYLVFAENKYQYRESRK